MTPPTEQFTVDQRIAVWSSIASRRASYDAMVWQTPSLGLAAQAFLLTLALGPDTSAFGRTISAALSLALSIMVIQLLAKHRLGELQDALLLQRMEGDLEFLENIGCEPHGTPLERSTESERERLSQEASRLVPRGLASFWGMSSVRLWIIGQWGFAGIAVLILVCAWAWPSGLTT